MAWVLKQATDPGQQSPALSAEPEKVISAYDLLMTFFGLSAIVNSGQRNRVMLMVKVGGPSAEIPVDLF
jgi:hypothetical protein